MPDVPGGSSRRSQRRAEPKEWSALDTPVGFERCVRATLRELYGYVALLTGRDRREAERHVADVYRSLYRAARAGDVEAVTLGALRSAARRTWLAEHRAELAATDEVSRASVSTIAELSALERAVIVLRHVNGMTVERTAAELGRTDREIAAIGAHAVRRLRGTDDTSGAWLRAYLGPSVTAAPRLVDRIVDQLGDHPVPEPPDGESGGTETETHDDTGSGEDEPVVVAPPDGPDEGNGPDEGGIAEEPGGPDEGGIAEEPGGPEQGGATEEPGGPDADAAPATTELPVVERPTLELAVVTSDVDGDVSGTEPITVGPFEGFGSPEPVEPPGRPRWVLVVGGVLLLALVVALVWLAVRGDADDTVASTPAHGTASDDTSDDGTASDETSGDGTASDEPGDTAPASTVAAGPIELGYDPACVERLGSEPTPVPWATSFGPLGADPVLTVDLPESVDVAADPERRPPGRSVVLRPDGIVLAVTPAPSHRTSRTIVARVGLDGTVAWVRCLDGTVEIGAAPDVGVDLAVGVAGAWTGLSLADGAPGDQLDAVQAAVLDTAGSTDDADGPDAGGITLGYSYDGELGRSVLAGLDDGSVEWRAADLVVPDAGFRAAAVGDTVVAQHCAPGEPADETGDTGCTTGELRGYDLATGELRWSRPGVHRVAATGDGYALVGDTTAWELIDVTTGAGVSGQRWDDTDVFETGADATTVVRDGGALVVNRPGSVEVWLPVDVSVVAAAVDLP